jgi:flagellar biosynthesis protein FlhG
VRDEPESLAYAYAIIKVLSRTHGVRRFQMLANMSTSQGGGESLFRKLQRVTDRFLDVVLEYAGEIPEDRFVRTAICGQRSVVTAFPSAPASRAFARLAQRTGKWQSVEGPRGNIEFMMERLLARPPARLEAVR